MEWRSDVALSTATCAGPPVDGWGSRGFGAAQVAVDNATSDRHSIVEVFADDRQGLLYEITHELFELGLSINSARISTRLDQIVDVFYVTGRQGGRKIPDDRVEAVRSRLLDVIRPKSPVPA